MMDLRLFSGTKLRTKLDTIDESKNARQIILYDLTTQKKYDLDKYIKYGQYGSNTYWEDFQVVNVTEENYSIVFSGTSCSRSLTCWLS